MRCGCSLAINKELRPLIKLITDTIIHKLAHIPLLFLEVILSRVWGKSNVVLNSVPGQPPLGFYSMQAVTLGISSPLPSRLLEHAACLWLSRVLLDVPVHLYFISTCSPNACLLLACLTPDRPRFLPAGGWCHELLTACPSPQGSPCFVLPSLPFGRPPEEGARLPVPSSPLQLCSILLPWLSHGRRAIRPVACFVQSVS